MIMKIFFFSIATISLMLSSCSGSASSKKAADKPEEIDHPLSAETAINAAQVAIMNQLPDPGSTIFDIDSVSNINDTLFYIAGFFRTKNEYNTYDRVGFDCKLGLTKDGESYELVEINTQE